MKFLALLLFLAPLISFAQSVQSPACVPDTAEARSWPVKAIYLHGLFTASGADTNGFRELEAGNRRKLAEIAQKLKIRIAIPVAPVGANRMRNWNTTSLPTIEQNAQTACGQSALARPRALIGFSNGGYTARRMAMDCRSVAAYGKILAIGAPNNTRASPCGSGLLTNTAPHVMPGFDYFERELWSLTAGTAASGGNRPQGATSR